MIDTNKKLMLVIVDPMGNCSVKYFKDDKTYHKSLLREYVHNESIDFSLKYDLEQADKRRKQMGTGNIEDNLYELTNVFTKNGYMLFYDMTDYREYTDGKKHSGNIALPTDLDHLSDVHKQVLNQFADQIIVDKVCNYKNTDKIVYSQLPVFCYNKELKKIDLDSQDFNEVLYELNTQSKHVK